MLHDYIINGTDKKYRKGTCEVLLKGYLEDLRRTYRYMANDLYFIRWNLDPKHTDLKTALMWEKDLHMQEDNIKYYKERIESIERYAR